MRMTMLMALFTWGSCAWLCLRSGRGQRRSLAMLSWAMLGHIDPGSTVTIQT